MGSRRGPNRDTFLRGEKRAQEIHKKLTDYLEQQKPIDLLLKTALQSIETNDSALNAIVISGRAVQKAYTNIQKLEIGKKELTSEEVSESIKKSWESVRQEKKLEKNLSLNNTILESLKQTLAYIYKKRGESK